MQLKQLKTRITQLSSDKESSKILDSYLSQVKERKSQIERYTKDVSPSRLYFSKAAKLVDELSFLSSANKQFAITKAQTTYIADLKVRHGKARKEIQAFIDKALNEWNAKLHEEYNVSNWIFLQLKSKPKPKTKEEKKSE